METGRRLAAIGMAVGLGTVGLVSLGVTPASAATATHTEFINGSPSDTFDYQFGQFVTMQVAVLTGDGGSSSPLPLGVGGTVAFYADGSGSPVAGCASVERDPDNGLFSCASRDFSVATHSLRATYSGQGEYTGSTTATDAPFRVVRADTALRYDGPTTFTPGVPFTVSAVLVTTWQNPDAPLVGHNVNFGLDAGGIAGCTAPTDASGRAACTVTPSATTTNVIMEYLGTAQYEFAGDQVLFPRVTTTTVTVVSGDGAPWGSSVVLRAVVAPAPADGTVDFVSYGQTLPNCGEQRLTAGVAVCTAYTLRPERPTVTAIYSGDFNYTGSSGTTTVNVAKHAVELTVTASQTPAKVGVPFTATGTLRDTTTSGPIVGASIDLTFQTTTCRAATNASGEASCSLTPGRVEVGLLRAGFDGNSLYDSDTTETALTAVEGPSAVVATAPQGIAGHPVRITASVTPLDATGTVTFTAAGGQPLCELVPLVVQAGAKVAHCDATTLAVGQTPVVARYNGEDEDYEPSVGDVTVTVVEATPVITAADVTAAVGEPFTAQATLVSDTGAPLSGRSVNLEWNGASCNATTDALGVAGCPFLATIVAQTGRLKATFDGAGDPIFTSATDDTATITITRAVTVLTMEPPAGAVYDAPATISAAVAPFAGVGSVVFEVAGTPIIGCEAVAVSLDGQASCTTAFTTVGSVTVAGRFLGNADYGADDGSTSFPVGQAPTTLTYDGAITAVVDQPAVLSATLRHGTTAAPLANKPVTFSWAGQSCLGVTDGDGQATCSITADAVTDSAVPARAEYEGSPEYVSSSDTERIIVAAAPTTITLNAPTTAVHTTPVELSAVVAGSNGDGTVEFTLAGEPIAGCDAVDLVLVGGDRTATCDVPSLPVGTATLVAEYSGTADYLPSSDDATVAVSQAVTDVIYQGPTAGVVASALALRATLTNTSAAGIALAGHEVSFEVDGLRCTATTDADGVASCTVTPTRSGSVEVNISYAGTADYTADTDEASALIAPAPTATTLDAPATTSFGEPVNVVATVAPAAAGAVSFTLDGADVAGCIALPVTSVDGAGTASCALPTLPVGDHVVAVHYAGTADYLASDATMTLSVAKSEPAITYVGDTSGVVGSPMTMAADLRTPAPPAPTFAFRTLAIPGGAPLAGRTVTFTLGAASCAAVTDQAGRATCTLTPASRDDTTLQIGFAGDAEYQTLSITLALAVAAAPTPPPTTPAPTAPNPGTELPQTGGDTGTTLALGALTVLLGLGLLAVRRRRCAR